MLSTGTDFPGCHRLADSIFTSVLKFTPSLRSVGPASSCTRPPSPSQTHLVPDALWLGGLIPSHSSRTASERPSAHSPGAEEEKKGLSNSRVQGGPDCVMQMINSNLWNLQSIPALTRKNRGGRGKYEGSWDKKPSRLFLKVAS